MAANRSELERKRPPRNRQQLLFEFDMQSDANEGVRQYFIGNAYPPCTEAVSELESIRLSDLTMDTHHRGRILFARTVDSGIRAAAIQTIVEDDSGAVERLAVYNAHSLEEATVLLQKNTVFAIKDPFLEAGATGNLCIRVDHPSDIVWIKPSDQIIPEAFREIPADSPSSAADWKAKGNEFYKAAKYIDAARAFTSGLDCEDATEKRIRCDILRNRAVTNILLKRFDEALVDAQAAVIATGYEPEAEIISLDSKAHYRAGRAAYELRKFEDAKQQFNEAVKLSPEDKDSIRELQRTDDRLKEQTTGNYDIGRIGDHVSKKRNRLDHADFLTNVEKREAGAHGNGLFASKDQAAGELILCEKAFAVSFDSDQGAQDFSLLDSMSHRQISGTQALLLFHVISKILHNPSKAHHLFDLYDGGYSQRGSMQIVDDVQVIDAFRAQAVLTYNTYGCPTVKTTSKVAQRQAKSSTGYPSTGFWSTVSFINHACNGNAMRSFLGDLMIVKATRDIKKGEEILMPYRLPVPENDVLQSQIEKIWGFRCDCSLCLAEADTPIRQRRDRAKILQESSDFLAANILSDAKPTTKKVISRIEKLMERLEKTYNDETFANKPRLGLTAPGKWLCQAHASQKDWNKLAEAAIGLLRNMGFVVAVSEQDGSVSISRAHCLLVDDAIDAAIYAAWAYESLKRSKPQERMLSFAKSLYEILNGEMNGFEEKRNGITGS